MSISVCSRDCDLTIEAAIKTLSAAFPLICFLYLFLNIHIASRIDNAWAIKHPFSWNRTSREEKWTCCYEIHARSLSYQRSKLYSLNSSLIVVFTWLFLLASLLAKAKTFLFLFWCFCFHSIRVITDLLNQSFDTKQKALQKRVLWFRLPTAHRTLLKAGSPRSDWLRWTCCSFECLRKPLS